MSLPRNLTPEVLTTSNVLLQIHIMAEEFEAANEEIDRVKDDRHITKAREDMLEPNWGALIEIPFNKSLTVDRYREILLGVIKARLVVPTVKSMVDIVRAFAPTASVSVLDYWAYGNYFIGPNPITFFKLNGTDPWNVWNGQGASWKPAVLLRALGFDKFGTQIWVTSVADEKEIALLNQVPAVLEFVRPAHQFVALIYEQEIAGP